jgi:hypothetical protein
MTEPSNEQSEVAAHAEAMVRQQFAICPMCGHNGTVDVSPHVFFSLDRMALRCRKCKHVWEKLESSASGDLCINQ